ncbi:hypothetical protein V1512DRAFT_15475 [Lipomyces arxii]|uniref:uncharacterized protein n=1 Tax=Lipomyces arxii TaxID=56418 RepID=UPI0034CDA6E5
MSLWYYKFQKSHTILFRFLFRRTALFAIVSLLNVNLNYPLYSPRKYRPVRMDSLAFNITRNISSMALPQNSTNGTAFNMTTAPSMFMLDNQEELKIEAGGRAQLDKLLQIVIPVFVVSFLAIIGLAVYLYMLVQKYIKRAVEAGILAHEQRQARTAIALATADSTLEPPTKCYSGVGNTYIETTEPVPSDADIDPRSDFERGRARHSRNEPSNLFARMFHRFQRAPYWY